MRILFAEDDRSLPAHHQVPAHGPRLSAWLCSNDRQPAWNFDLAPRPHSPDGDGYRVVYAIRSLQGVGGGGDDGRTPRRSERFAVAGILRKPFDIDELEKVVGRFGT
jgi:hypothetical protein